MKIAIVCSNYLSIKKDTKKGTEIIAYDFIRCLEKRSKENNLEITVFASGDSDLPVKIESVGNTPFSKNDYLTKAGKHFIFELALLSRAFSQQEEFDLYHIHIGDGDIAIPFAPFVKKPILITLYHPTDERYAAEYFSLFKNNKNVFFVSPTDWQRKYLSSLPYVGTIYHGINGEEDFHFSPDGGNEMMWAGRAIPQKGLETILEVAKRVRKKVKLFAIPKKEHEEWFNGILKEIDELKSSVPISIALNKDRLELNEHYQTSKLFLFPISWEEPFGLVMAESLACGTPVVAYAQGFVPEIIRDGETGFIVNLSEEDIRGNWIIKKTGIEGLCEAIERIYSMPDKEYEKMRKACRNHFEKNFTIEKMTKEYEKIYQKFNR